MDHRGKVPGIRDKLVHFPGVLTDKVACVAIVLECNRGKCHRFVEIWFTFPGKNGKMALKSTFSRGKCTKFAGKWFTFRIRINVVEVRVWTIL